jgi:periplasmic protein TonB
MADTSSPIVSLATLQRGSANTVFYRPASRRWLRWTSYKRNLAIGAAISALVHVGLLFSDRFQDILSPLPKLKPKEESPMVELLLAAPEANQVVSAESESDSAPASDYVPSCPNELPSRVAIDSSRFIMEVALPPSMTDGHGLGFAKVGLSDGFLSGKKRIFEIAELDQQPEVKKQPLPVYPSELRRAGVTGEVVVGFVVNARGEVCKQHVISSTRSEFEPPALQAVSHWQFRPGKKSGRPVAVRMEAPIAFALSSKN